MCDTYNVVGPRCLSVGGVQCLPSGSGGVAASPDVESVERNLWLRALSSHELCSAAEGDFIDHEWVVVTPVADDVDGRGPVDEVLSQSLEGELVRVLLNESAEDVRGLLCLLLVQAPSALGDRTCPVTWRWRGAVVWDCWRHW